MKNQKLKEILSQLFYLLLANIFYTTAIQLFLIKNNIVAGGFAGIATVINHLAPISVGNVVLIMNIPLLLISVKIMNISFGIKTLVSILMFTFLSNIMEPIPVVINDRFAAAVIGGVLNGVGAVCVYLAQTSSGSADLLARLLLKRFQDIPLGRMFMIIDGCIVLLSIIVFKNIESGVYAITAIFVYGYVNDRIISGFDKAYISFVITEEDPAPISEAAMTQMHIGVTNVPCIGMYARKSKSLLIVLVRPKDVEGFKRIVYSFDKNAFIFLGWANHVAGGRLTQIRHKP